MLVGQLLSSQFFICIFIFFLEKKSGWIDFNAGKLVEETPMEELSQELFQYVLDVASGKKVKAEEAGFHDMAIFKQGVTL